MIRPMIRIITIGLAALTLLATASSASAAIHHPVACFRAHGWQVHGTNLRGTARKPQSGVPMKYWSYVTWAGPAPYGISYFATNRQKRLIKLCLGRI